MSLRSRKLLNHSFTSASVISIVLVGAALIILLAPIVSGGLRAFIFRGTIEHRRVMCDEFGHGDQAEVEAEYERVVAVRQPVFDMITNFETELKEMDYAQRREYRTALRDLKDQLHELFGPFPGEDEPALLRDKYGPTRWSRAQIALHHTLNVESYDYSDPTQMGNVVYTPRADDFRGTSIEPLFSYLDQNAEALFEPQWTFYWRFLFDEPKDVFIFGGIWPQLLGTLYLTLGAILFAVPVGVISAIYLSEYAPDMWFVGVLRTCVSTLAGVPSIVFGLFGLAFFINGIHISSTKSILAGSLTLGVLILPVVIRASEEALRAVPRTYKEAALSLGSSRWASIYKVMLPAALPGILTGVVISMGRAAGETAPIIFTAAASQIVGRSLGFFETFTQPTSVLSWSIYNVATEHEAADEIRHVQYGMVLVLVLLVLLLNGGAIIMRARITRKLTG